MNPLEIPRVKEAIIYSTATKDIIAEDSDALTDRERSNRAGVKLLELSEKCRGMSGRTLRRLPVLAHARYIGMPLPSSSFKTTSSSSNNPPSPGITRESKSRNKTKKTGESLRKIGGPRTDVEQWLEAMHQVALSQSGERARIDSL